MHQNVHIINSLPGVGLAIRNSLTKVRNFFIIKTIWPSIRTVHVGFETACANFMYT